MLYSEMRFEWDDSKAQSNYKKHKVSFFEAVTIWSDDSSLEMIDPNFYTDRTRWLRMGFSKKANLLIVVFVEKADYGVIRIISARKATKKEAIQYSKGAQYER